MSVNVHQGRWGCAKNTFGMHMYSMCHTLALWLTTALQGQKDRNFGTRPQSVPHLAYVKTCFTNENIMPLNPVCVIGWLWFKEAADMQGFPRQTKTFPKFKWALIRIIVNASFSTNSGSFCVIVCFAEHHLRVLIISYKTGILSSNLTCIIVCTTYLGYMCVCMYLCMYVCMYICI